jgi:hypothetical protein
MDGRADMRQNETITVDPVGVLWIERHELVEEHMGDGSQAHGGARMAGIGLERGIRLGALAEQFGQGQLTARVRMVFMQSQSSLE